MKSIKGLSRLFAVGLLVLAGSVPSFAWTPKRLFQGKLGFSISVGAVTVANFEDYRWTVKDVYSGAGHEANPFLLNNQGTLDKDRLMGVKVGSVGLIGLELLAIHKHPNIRPVFTAVNWSAAGILGATAYNNRKIFGR